MKTVCFTGHRPEVLGGYDKDAPLNLKVRENLRKAVKAFKELGYRTFISGGALGVDQWGADAVLEDPELELVIALPYKDYGSNWPPESQAYLAGQCKKASKVHVVCEGEYAGWKNNERNKWMVDNSDAVIAVWNGAEKGGTAHCVKYAKEKGKPMFRYDPATDVVIEAEPTPLPRQVRTLRQRSHYGEADVFAVAPAPLPLPTIRWLPCLHVPTPPLSPASLSVDQLQSVISGI